ncbi:hypothetical protein MYAM1_003261 [Malassezia yamatoensis]|uniref:Large ribosomal subunit protein bL21m n=1 Tax=Malassezia yamatoensis TaxID=253288 RepID=A0AAJ6CKA1_9BASI|nr:hypothetical protein MYAM1_003261 [Malassezia yamatoensis]
MMHTSSRLAKDFASFSTAAPTTTTATSSTLLDHTEQVQETEEALQLLRAQPNHYVIASITGRTFVLSESDIVTLPRMKGVQVGDVLELDRVHEVGSRNYTLRAQDPALGRRKAHGGKYPLVLFQEHSSSASPIARAVGVKSPSTTFANTPPESVLPWSSSWAAQLIPSGLAHVGASLKPNVVRVRCVVLEHTKGPMERIEKFKRRKGYDKVITHKQPYTRLRVDSITLGSS